MLMLIVPHILASPLNPPVVGIITVYQSFIWRPANQSPSFYIKEGKKEAVIKKLFHLNANLHYTIFSDLILRQISQAIWASSEKVLGKKNSSKCVWDSLIAAKSGLSAACRFCNDMPAGFFSH